MPPAKNAKIAANNAERQQIVENPIDRDMADVTFSGTGNWITI